MAEEIPKGFERNADGVLVWQPGGIGTPRPYYRDPGEAVIAHRGHPHGLGFVCTESVMGSTRNGPCSKRPKFDPDARGNFTRCGVHSAAAVEARKEKTRAHYAALNAESTRRNAIYQARQGFEDALRSIAGGHNDPRACAQEALDRLSRAIRGEPDA